MAFDIRQSVGFLLVKAYQRMHTHFRAELAPFGLTPPQFALLAFLWRDDGLSQTELTALTEIDRSTLCGVIDRLQGAGLVERRQHPSDRRAFQIYLTPAGRSLEQQLEPFVLRARQRFTHSLAEGEYEQLCCLLDKLRA